jgi:hypothetical protein
VDLRTPLGLAPLEFPTSAPRDLVRMFKYETLNITCNAWGAKYNMLHDQEYFTYLNSSKLFNNLSLSFLIH